MLRENLQRLQVGKGPRLVVIGFLTQTQVDEINAKRSTEGLPPISAEVVFVGKHLFNSRVVEDGYSIDDVIDQIESGMAGSSVVASNPARAMIENPVPRADRYGNLVSDRVVFECTGRYPRAELFSVTPKGDKNRPVKTTEAIPVDSLCPISNDSPG